jgi:Leucine Rich repeat
LFDLQNQTFRTFDAKSLIYAGVANVETTKISAHDTENTLLTLSLKILVASKESIMSIKFSPSFVEVLEIVYNDQMLGFKEIVLLEIAVSDSTKGQWHFVRAKLLTIDVESYQMKSRTITDKCLSAWAKKCPHLQKINISGCMRITEIGIKELAKCYGLQSINLSGCVRINDACVTALGENCPLLKSINLNGCVLINDADVTALGEHFPDLEEVSLSGCDHVTSAGIVAVANGCMKLTSIDVSCCTLIGDLGISALGEKCPDLKEVSLSGCDHVTSAGLVAVANGCKKLTSIDVSCCVLITDLGISALGEHCPDLEEVNLSQCVLVTYIGTVALAKGCHKLKSIDMSYCPVIKGISALGVHCPLLQSIDLSGCVKINNNGITLLAEGCRDLISIDLDCTLITDLGLSQLPQYCSKLQSISLTTCVGITYRGIAALDRGCLQLQDDSIEIEGCKDVENILERISARDTEKNISQMRIILTICSQRVFQDQEGSGVVDLAVNDDITITDDGILALAKKFPHLLEVEINGCEMVTGAGIIALCAHCSVLQIVNLARCDCVVDDIVFWNLMMTCPLLVKIMLSRTAIITALGLGASSLNSHLKTIDIDNCVGINWDIGLHTLAFRCHGLEELMLTFRDEFEGITDFGLVALGEKCKQLKVFKLNFLNFNNHCITLTGISQITLNCTYLYKIDMNNVFNVDDDALLILRMNCSRLQHLSVNSTRVTKDGVKRFVDACINFKSISIKNSLTINNKDKILLCNEFIDKIVI